MKFIADFHIHSKYSRATSKDMNIEELDRWARIKGIDVLGTGDFTHPKWFRELEEKLEPAEEGLYKLKSKLSGSDPDSFTRFILTVEVSSIYSQGGKVRRIHNIVFAPSFEAARKINRKLAEVGNLRADGRPILGLPAKELLKIALDASEDCMLVPSHAWTPWFSIFGSKSGFDSIEECFEDMSEYIYAMETGLSSDPAMNWRLSALDDITLISNSDCHSARRIGREANIFSAEGGTVKRASRVRRGGGSELNYKNIIDAIKYSRRGSDPQRGVRPPSARPTPHMHLVETVEFFPEEGKYHYDGHRDCGVRLSPKETKVISALCPKCGTPLTVGVLSRVEELADRAEGYKPQNAVPFRSLVPLDEIIAESLGVAGTQTKTVVKEYNKLIEFFGSEFKILLETPKGEIEKVASPGVSEAIRRVREGELNVKPGYDGEYGKVEIFTKKEKKSARKQGSLF